MDAAGVSCVLKGRLRESLEALQKDIHAAKSRALMQRVEVEVVQLKQVICCCYLFILIVYCWLYTTVLLHVVMSSIVDL